MDSHASPLSGIVARLERARNRIRIRALAEAAIWGATAGLAVFALFEVIQRVLPGVWRAAFGASDIGLSVWLGVGATVVVVGIGAALALSRTPDVAGLAQQADHRFGLSERLSTAIEAERLAGSRPPSSVVAALIDDAVSRGRVVDARLLAPFRLPRTAWALPGVALIALLVATIVPQTVLPLSADAAVTETTGAPVTEAERIEAAETIARVADLVAEQAERRSDAYMEAVANTLRDLGERVSSGPATSRSEVVNQLTALADYAAQASSEYRGTDSRRVPELIEALSRSIAASQPPDATVAEGRTPAPGEQTADSGAEPGAPSSQGGAATDIEDMLAQLEDRGNGEAGPDTPAADGENANVARSYMEAAAEQNAARAAQAAQNPEGGAELIGPSSNAQAGDSLLAGGGSDAIGDQPVAPVQVEFEKSSELVLQAEDTGEGTRLDLELAPEARLTTITEQSLGEAASGWQRAQEEEVSRYAIDFDEREQVSRFMRALKGHAAP